jgi:hypothetical protein
MSATCMEFDSTKKVKSLPLNLLSYMARQENSSTGSHPNGAISPLYRTHAASYVMQLLPISIALQGHTTPNSQTSLNQARSAISRLNRWSLICRLDQGILQAYMLYRMALGPYLHSSLGGQLRNVIVIQSEQIEDID